MTINLLSTQLSIIPENYLTQSGDVLIFPTNDYLWMGNPITSDIKKRAGHLVEQEALEQGPVPIGTSVITSGGNLSFKHLVHCACITQDMHIELEQVQNYIQDSLKNAAQTQCKSITIIPFFWDNLHVSVYSIAESMLQGIIAYCLHGKTPLKTLTIASGNEELFVIFQESLSKIFKAKKK